MSAHASSPEQTTTIPVVEEVSRVDKVVVDRGGYRITKRVVSNDEPTTQSVHETRYVIERRPVGAQLPDLVAPSTRQEGDTLVIPVVREVLVTEKRLVLVEEIRITRSDVDHETHQSVTLHREEVSIEALSPEGAPSLSGERDPHPTVLAPTGQQPERKEP